MDFSFVFEDQPSTSACIDLQGLKNFKHMLINNAVHDSVGGQPTGLGHVFFDGLIKFDAHIDASPNV